MSKVKKKVRISAKNVRLTNEALRKDVEPILIGMNIPYEKWGRKGATRSFSDFIGALGKNEIRWEYESQSPILEMDVAVVTIRTEIGGRPYELRETHREFSNGYVERRNGFNGSLAETVIDKETGYAAAVRGLAEELGQTKRLFRNPSNFHLTLEGYETLDPQPFPSYPPFDIIFHRRKFTCIIDKRLYAKRYVCVEKNKITYFGWVKI